MDGPREVAPRSSFENFSAKQQEGKDEPVPCRGLVDATSAPPGGIGRGGKKPTMHFGTLLLCGIFPGQKHRSHKWKILRLGETGVSQGAETCNFFLVF